MPRVPPSNLVRFGPFIILSCLLFLVSAGDPSTIDAVAADEPAAKDGAPLFTGKNLDGWRNETGDWQAAQSVTLDPGDPAKFVVAAGSGILVNGKTGKTVNLITEPEFGDVEAHIEFCVPKDSNSGVYFMGRYEIQVLDSFGKTDLKYGDNGGIYHNDKGWKGKAPAVNASKAPGEWQTFDVVFRAPRFDADGKKTGDARFVKVVHNGKLIHENVDVNAPTIAAAYTDEKPAGPIMLQGDHGPVAYRNLRIKKLK